MSPATRPGAPTASYPAAVGRRGRDVLPVAVLVVTGVLLVLGYLLKAQCIPDYDADRDRLLCSNDIQVLYAARDLGEHRFPYVGGGIDAQGRLSGGVVEYPVLTGLFAWFAALAADDAGAYLRVTAALLAPFALLTSWLLVRLTGARALVWAATPPLVWYSFHNWDLLVVAAAVGAIAAWYAGRPAAAAGLLAVGACLKLWPGLFVAPLVLERLRAGDRRGAARAAAAAVAVVALVNLPFLLANPGGWWAPYAFQQRRAADVTSNSIWYWSGEHLSTAQLNRLVPVLLLAGGAAVLVAGWLRRGPYPFVQASGALLCVFLLVNKAHSPQFVLWLLPFFALVRLRWGWAAAYLVFDTLLYVGLFRWFHDLAQGDDFGLPKQMLILGVWGRAAVLTLLPAVLLRTSTALVPPDRDGPDQPTQRPLVNARASTTDNGAQSQR